MPVIEKIVEVLSKLPPGALELVAELVEGALKDDDPEEFLRRKVEAEAAHKAAQEVVDAALRGTR
jgi:hypothetical protein